jgi:hypothetical protein
VAKKKYKFDFINRRVHMYAGLIMIPYIFIFGLSGLLFNHPTWLINRTSDSYTLTEENSFNRLFPDLEKLAYSVKDSLLSKGELFDGQVTDVGYDNLMILRNINDVEDYRVQIDIPSSKVEVMSLPDFVDKTTVSRGNILFENLVSERELFENLKNVLKKKELVPGKSRLQRVPNLAFNVSNSDKSYKVVFNLINGNYRVINPDNREFKMNYFLTNIHQEHGYPINGFSVKWLWVFFADLLGFLMIIWAISGFIMWYKIKKSRAIGAVVLCLTALLSFYLLIAQYDLGF